MKEKVKIKVHFWDQMVLIGFGLALFYAVFDSVLYIFMSYDVDFFQRLFGPDISAIWSRIAILCLFVIFGSHAQFTINQRAAAEAALRESEEKFRTIIETTPDGYYEVDLEGRFTFFNDSMCNILGYARSEISGRSQLESLDEVDAKKLTETFKNVLETGDPVKSMDWTLVNKDGTRRFVESSVSLIKDPKGQPTGFGGFLRDVTQRKRAEAMYRAKLAAEAASRTKSEFLASMSHEIRTPLNSIIGLVELMLDSDLPPDKREDLDVVKSSAYSLLSIINNILDFSKIEAGKLDFDETPFSFERFMAETMKIMAMKSHEKGIELAYRVAPDVPDRLLGDPVRLRQVLLNLVDNAVKFTDQGEVVVHVDVQSQTDYEVVLDIAVADTGIGIPRDRQRSIFGAYTQADPSTARRYGGTGLGLAVCARLVELMGGQIKLTSRPGHGSRFRFSARFVKQQDGKSPKKREPDPGLAGLKAIVVDDNESSRKILLEILTGWGMDPLPASGAEEAQRLLQPAASRQAPATLALIDSDMPATDGFALAEWIARQGITGIRVIMMMTFPHLKRREELKDPAIAAALVKPLGAGELFDAVLDALKIEKHPLELLSVEAERVLPHPTRSLKVLVAEDTPFNQKFIMRLLERWGHRSTLVEDGCEVLETLQKDPFDLILMDVSMPGMDGLEATRAIREAEKAHGGHLPIVAMTAHAVKGDRERCLAAGMDEYVSKPIDLDKLFNIMEALSQGREVPGASEGFGARLDKDMLLKAFDQDWSFFKEVVDVFLSDYPRLMDNLRLAFKEGDCDTLTRSAHSLKGMLRNFQAEEAAAIAFDIEQKGKQEQFEGLETAIDDLAAAIAGVDSTLRNILAQES